MNLGDFFVTSSTHVKSTTQPNFEYMKDNQYNFLITMKLPFHSSSRLLEVVESCEQEIQITFRFNFALVEFLLNASLTSSAKTKQREHLKNRFGEVNESEMNY